jgi:tricarballylate dehydrogenase
MAARPRFLHKDKAVGALELVLKTPYTCGEMAGGLFHYTYPAGTGLVSGATLGRIAGRNAAKE